MHLRRHVLQQKRHHVHDNSRVDYMKIIQDEREWIRVPRDLVDQEMEGTIERNRLHPLRYAKQIVSYTRDNPFKRRDTVLKKTKGIIIVFVQREPGGGKPGRVQPAADESGFAVTGWGRDQDELALNRSI